MRVVNETRDVLGLPEALANGKQVFVVHGAPLRDRMSIRLATTSRAVVCVAHHLRDEVEEAYPRAQVEVVTNASTDLAPGGLHGRPAPGEDVHLLWAGTINANKAPQEAVAIAARIARVGVRVHLTIVGPHADAALVKDLLEAGHGALGPRFELREPVSDLRPFFERAHYVLITSVREGLPRVGMEALSAGVPVAGYASPGVEELVASSPLVASWGDAETVAGGVVSSLSSWTDLARGARDRYVAAFTPARQWRDYEALFKRRDLWHHLVKR